MLSYWPPSTHSSLAFVLWIYCYYHHTHRVLIIVIITEVPASPVFSVLSASSGFPPCSVFSQDPTVCHFNSSSVLTYRFLAPLTFFHSCSDTPPVSFWSHLPLLPAFSRTPAFVCFSFCVFSLGAGISSHGLHCHPSTDGSQLCVSSPDLSPRTSDLRFQLLVLYLLALHSQHVQV